jgi:DNA-binding transcriptional LysR family regulator
MILSLPQRIAEQFTRFAALDIFPVPIDLPDYELTMIWHPLRDKDPALVWLRGLLADIGQTFAAL